MNYNYLLYFSMLAQTEHYTTAAARLGISQPALSSAIHNLENALGGVKLFEKVGRNIRLTEEGRFYQEMVDDAIKKLQGASQVLRNSKLLAPVVIRVGVVSGALNGPISQEIVNCSRQNKRIRFHITESSAENLMDLVRQEKLDMAIVDYSDRDRSLHFRKLYEKDLLVAMPTSHPLANRTSIDPQELTSEPKIVFDYNMGKSFREWATGDSGEEGIICTVDTSRAALDLVAAGLGITYIPTDCAEPRPGIKYVPVENRHQVLFMCFLYNRWLEPLAWEFVEAVIKAFQKKRFSARAESQPNELKKG